MDRAPAVAGRFYPAEAEALSSEVARLIGPNSRDEPALGIIAPHAGYMYSGAIAGEVYAAIRVPDVVVVLCPNHTGIGARAAIISSGAWLVPNGRVPVDSQVAEALRRKAMLTEDERAHAREHALEVHLPFLLHRNPNVRIVPVCLATHDYSECERIGLVLADVIQRCAGEVLVVASTDMSHYVTAERAKARDRLALDRIQALDPAGLHDAVLVHDISMCGFVPTTVALVCAKELGAQRADLVRYGNSGDVTGDYGRVVGYAGFVID